VTLEDKVFEILRPINNPVTHLIRPKDIPGVSYHIIDRRPTLYGDGKPMREETSIQVDVWTSCGESQSIERRITQAMTTAGFKYTRQEDGVDTQAGIYQKTLVFYLEFKSEDYNE